ncbi:MAG: phosphotransferase [Actinomycetota bacterium]|nr:phosphotransferase [Actinomycetota bacterium]
MASSAVTLSVVATPESSLVAASADIAAHWGIELGASIEPLASRHLVVRSGAYIIHDAKTSLESVLWEHEFLAFLAPRVPEVVAPLAALDGSTFLAVGDHVVSVTPHIPAERADRSAPIVRHEVPRLLARLHQAADEWPRARPRPGRPSWRELDWVANDTWDWTVLDRTALLERAYEASREWLASPPPLAESAVHGDFHSDNLLASERGIEGLIDWEFARIDWPASDLAAAVMVLSLQRDGTIDQRIAEETVAAYVDAGGRDESYALEPLLRQVLLAVALHARTRKATGQSWSPEFQGMLEGALERFV